MKGAHRNIESIQALNICQDINNLVLKQDTMIAIHTGYIAESVQKTSGNMQECA